MFKALIITNSKDLTKEDQDSFWSQGVDLDDWDYMILIEDPEEKILRKNNDGMYADGKFCPKDYDLERLLVGCCSNRWYKAKFREKKYAIGVAYHA